LLQILSLLGLVSLLIKGRLGVVRRFWPFERSQTYSPQWVIVAICVIVLTISNLVAPEMSWDAITYQLVLPRYYLIHHCFYPVIGMIPSHYPALGEMFFSWGLAWGNDSIARSFCFLANLGTTLTLIALGTRLVSARTGWYAAAFYFFFPYLNIYSSRGYVDLFTGFYAVLGLGTLVLLVLNRITTGNEQKGKGILLLIAFAMGTIWAIKYNAMAYGLTAFFILIFYRTKHKFLFSAMLILASLFFIFPWALKSWEYVHNPLYPYLADWFHSFEWNEFDQRVSNIKFPFEGIKGILQLPVVLWGIFFNRYSGAPNEEIGLAILVFSPLLLMKGLDRKVIGVIGVAASVPFLFWLVTSHQLRLMTPVIALASLIAALGFEQALRNWKSHVKWLSLLPLVLAWAAVFYLFQGLLNQPNPFPHFFGLQTRENFLKQVMRPTSYVDLNDYLNKTLPADAKVLILGQLNGYYLQRESLYDFDYTYPVLKEWADESLSPEELYHWFLKNNFSYLLYNSNGMMAAAVQAEDLGFERYAWTPSELHNYEQFFLRYTQKIPLVLANGYSLYRVGPRSGFSTMPEFLPGTEKYYLDDMVRLMGLKKTSDIFGVSLKSDIYKKAYDAVSQQHPEMGYPCFQSALAELADGATEKDVLEKGKLGLDRNGDEASWFALKADVLLEKGRTHAAVPFLEKAQLLSPEKDDVARNLAVAYYNEHHLDQAVREAQQALNLAPYSVDYQNLLTQLKGLEQKH
jgi:tetratricopeptide (TPR) repeat protein